MPRTWIDVDFHQLGAFGDLGSERFGSGTAFEDAIGLVPRTEWPDLIAALESQHSGLEWLITRIYDQGSEGSCTSNASCQAFEILQAVQAGNDKVVRLSPISLYKRVARGPNSGSAVDDNLQELVQRGVLPLEGEGFAHEMPHRGFWTPWPPGWERTAQQFRVLEYFEVRSPEGLVSALLKGFPVVGGRQGHAICYVRPVLDGRRLLVAYVNSWGLRGDAFGAFPAGFGFDSESYFARASQWAFAIRSVTSPRILEEPR